jgi:hypothetical protein
MIVFRRRLVAFGTLLMSASGWLRSLGLDPLDDRFRPQAVFHEFS